MKLNVNCKLAALLLLTFPALSYSNQPKYAVVLPQNFEMQLDNGQTIKVKGYDKIVAGPQKTEIMGITYYADDINDVSKLCKTAKLIWPKLKPMVEERGFSWGVVKASKPVESYVLGTGNVTNNKTYTIGWSKDGKGNWALYSDECK